MVLSVWEGSLALGIESRVREYSLASSAWVQPPAASFLTASVVSGWPAIPHSPLLTSSTTTQVTWRRFSPSIETIVSVSRSTISCFCLRVKTP